MRLDQLFALPLAAILAALTGCSATTSTAWPTDAESEVALHSRDPRPRHWAEARHEAHAGQEAEAGKEIEPGRSVESDVAGAVMGAIFVGLLTAGAEQAGSYHFGGHEGAPHAYAAPRAAPPPPVVHEVARVHVVSPSPAPGKK